MAQSILELIFKTSKQGTGGKAAAAELKDLKGTVGEVTSGFLGLNLGTLSAAGAVVAVGSAVVDATKGFLDYGETIRGLAAITGTGTEQTSRLLQAFDDLGVSQEKFTSAMTVAARKGFVATIDNVAKLADEYNALGTQEEKNALLNKELGKGGLDLAKAFEAGGQAIRNRAAAQEAGLVLTEEEAAQAEKLRINIDNLTDSWEALKLTVGGGVAIAINDGIDRLDLMAKASEWSGLKLQYLSQEMQNQTIAAYQYAMSLTQINSSQDAGVVKTEALTQALVYQGVTGWAALPPFMQGYIKAADEARAASEGSTTALGNTAQSFGYLQSQAAAAKSEVEAAKASLQTFGENLGGQVQAALEGAGVKGDQLTAALGVLDKEFGTNLQWQNNVKTSAEQLAAQYAKTGDLAAFQAALDTNITKLEAQNTTLAAAKNLVEENYKQLIKLTEHEWVVNLRYQIQGSAPSNPTQPAPYDPTKDKIGLSPTGGGQANAGIVTIPAGFPNDSYLLPVSSGETVSVVNDRMRATGGGGISGASVVIQAVYINNGMDLATFEARLTDTLRRRM